MLLQAIDLDHHNYIGQLIDAGLLAVTYAGFRLSARHDKKEAQQKREADKLIQERRHTENTERLIVLQAFHENQVLFNTKQHEQISLLREQTAALTQIAQGLDRRLILIEDRNNKS